VPSRIILGNEREEALLALTAHVGQDAMITVRLGNAGSVRVHWSGRLETAGSASRDGTNHPFKIISNHGAIISFWTNTVRQLVVSSDPDVSLRLQILVDAAAPAPAPPAINPAGEIALLPTTGGVQL
jgi:hypothetical protein